MTFTKVSSIREEQRAWVECENPHCDEGWVHGFNYRGDEESRKCELCQGEGGRWHEAVECRSSHPEAEAHLIGCDYGRDCWAEKSTILVREWEVCSKCSGDGEYQVFRNMGCDGEESCDHCHKDADGKPTGAEPDTATPWRVRVEP